MKTATEVLSRIDAQIEKMQAEAVGPCIDALIEWQDREAYRDAMRKAYGLKAVIALRQNLADEIECNILPAEGAAKPRRRTGKRNG